MMEKRIVVVNALTGQETPLAINEGVTPMEIVRQVGLPDCELARVSDQRLLPEQCDVARSVADGEHLFAFAPMKVGVANGRGS